MNNYFLPEKNEVKNKINLVLYFTILGYIISLFIKDAPVITNMLMAFILLLSLLSAPTNSYWERFSKNKISAGIIIFYLYQIISVFLSENIQEGLSILILRLPLLILPLSFCFIEFDKKIWNKILLFYALATTLASIVGFVFGLYRTMVENDTGNLYNDNISNIIGRQAVYFALNVGIAIMALVVQLKENPPVIQKHRWLIHVGIVWLLFIVCMLASRTAMFGILLILGLYILNTKIKERKFIEIALLFFSLIIGSIIICKIFPKILNRFKGTTEMNYQFDNKNVENHFNEEYDESKWNGTSTRAAIWKCAFEIWEKEPILGTGIGDRNNELMKKYEEKQFLYGLNTEKNTHNQYLEVLLSMGILGLMVFVIVFFIYPLKIILKQKQTFALGVFVLLGICFITENMLDRYQGLVFIPFILLLSSKSI